MAEVFVEFGAEGLTYFVDKYWDRGYDLLFPPVSRASGNHKNPLSSASSRSSLYSASAGGKRQRHCENRLPRSPASLRSSSSSASRRPRVKHRQPPVGLRGGALSAIGEEDSLGDCDRRIIPTTRLRPRLPNSTAINTMSYANGYGGGGGGSQQPRANSAQPPRNRYYDDDEEYGSDYDDRSGRRYADTGRGYDYQANDDRGYGREVIETERYKGPARDFEARRQSMRSNDAYGPGAMTQYSRQGGDDYNQSRRSRSRGSRGSRGGRGRDRSVSQSRSRSRSYSRSRSGSRGGDRGIQQKIGEHFDTSLQGIGVGLAGAVVGGMAGRHFGERNPRHKNRDILLGALVGGLGANAAETKWRGWMDEKKERVHEDEERWDQKWDGRDYGRSRSAMR